MPNQEVLDKFNDGCRRGNHFLIEILSSGNEDEKTVVRRCEICGAIVVDTDVDNRTAPGDIMYMRLPKLLREAA